MNLRQIENSIVAGKTLTPEQEDYARKKIDTYWDEHPDVTHRFPRWRKYIAWVAGYQLYDYNKVTKKLVEVPLNREHRIVFNKLRPYVKTVLAKLNSDAPQMGIIPNTTDDEDVRAASVGDKVIRGLADKIHFIQKLNHVKSWLVICNRAYMRVFWDEESVGYLGKVESEPEEDTDTPTGEGINSLTESNVTNDLAEVDGDVNIICVPPFNCRPDPLYYEREHWRWFVYGREEDAGKIEREYDLPSKSLTDKGQTLEQAYTLDMHDNYDIMAGGGTPEKREDISGRTVVVKELWTKKIYIFTAGDKVLDYGINSYGEIPFFQFEERIIPIDSYQREYTYNESIIKDLIPIQREYNRISSIMSGLLDKASKLKVLLPLGSILSKRQWTNDYGTFIDANTRMGTPFQMKLDPFPVEVPAYKSGLEREMEMLFSLSPASFGRLPERASHASGTLVNLLIEQDDVVLNPLLNHINDVTSDVWNLALRIVQDKYVEERIIKTIGEDGRPGAIKFLGADLQNNTDVKVTSQSGLPRSRALKTEYIMKLREVGLLTDDRAALEMLNLGNVEKIYTDVMLHENRALRENARILDNPMINPMEVQGWVYPLENHETHLKIHLRLRLGIEWDKLTDLQKQAHDAHMAETLEALMPSPEEQAMAEGGAPTPNESAAAGPAGNVPPQPARQMTGAPPIR